MKIVLEILKRYLFEIGCGAGAALGIALTVFGLSSMSGVVQQMEDAYRLKNQITGMGRASELANEKAVEKAQARIDRIKAGYADVLAFVRRLNQHEPLTNTVFPNSRSPDDGVAFRRAYQQEVASWPAILHAGGLPTLDDIARERDLIEAEKPVDTSLGADRPVQDAEGAGGAEAEREKEVDPRKDPEIRAAIRRAQSVYCYATPDSFCQSDVSRRDGPMYAVRPPTLEEMWTAQLEVWVQRDIVNAIAAVNNTVAEQLKAEAEKAASDEERKRLVPWVGNLPIKELVSFQMTPYLTDQPAPAADTGRTAPGPGPGPAPASAAGSVEASFTGNQGNELYDLLHFTVTLVVDARAIPEVLAGLSRTGFHTPIRVSYEAVPPDPSMRGKIYGDAPVVKLVVDFETVFFSELYVLLMPDKILERLGKQRPEPVDLGGA